MRVCTKACACAKSSCPVLSAVDLTACMYGPEGMHPANVPKTDKEWDKYEEGHNFPEACTPKYEGLVASYLLSYPMPTRCPVLSRTFGF